MSETWNNDQIASFIARDIPDGAYVNLGIGRPEAVANHIPADKEIILQSENGLLGMGGAASDNERDMELVNAGKKPITMLPGGAFFHHADSFAMIRGGHLDVCVLGGFQVAANGDVANWSTGEPSAWAHSTGLRSRRHCEVVRPMAPPALRFPLEWSSCPTT